MEENIKLKVLEKYSKDYLDKNLVFVVDKDSFIGPDGYIYKVYSSKELDNEINNYSDMLSTYIYDEILLLCKKYGLESYTNFITVNKDMIDYEVNNTDLCNILNVDEVLEEEYPYTGDTYTICRCDGQ